MLQSLIDQFSYPWKTEGKPLDWILAAGILMCVAFLWNLILVELLGRN